MSEQQDRHGPKYWVNTVSLQHVRLGMQGGFTQADHGRSTRLKRLSPGDGLVFYSPRTAMGSGAPLQQFTALGLVTGIELYQGQVTAGRSAARTLVDTATPPRSATRNAGGDMSPDFSPWRLAVEFLDVRPAPVHPLVPDLEFIPDPKRWGFPFRRGLFEISQSDFRRIAEAMGIDWASSLAPGRR